MLEVNHIENHNRQALQVILKNESLCFNDINDEGVVLFEVKEKEIIIGYFGYELYGSYALFRSMVVVEGYRKMGYGALIWHEAKKKLRANQVAKVYLLTNTASEFFKGQGFNEIQRSSAPEEIASTTEFIEFCPSDSVCMMINLTDK